MVWCRLVLKEFVYHTDAEMKGQKKGEILQKLARNMFRVMRSYEVHAPFPADVEFICSRLDRKFTDWQKYERKRARETKEETSNYEISIINEEVQQTTNNFFSHENSIKIL